MKKQYEKPRVLIEDYSMSEICASSPCEEKLNFADGYSCHSLMSFEEIDEDLNVITTYLFNKGNNDCTAGWMDELGESNGVCYHGPENRNFFTS